MERRKESKFDFMLGNKFKSNVTFFMSVIAIALYVMNPIRARELCMCAILVSTIADLVLMDYKNIATMLFGQKKFYVGMLLFGITHVVYMVCFWGIMLKNGAFIHTLEVNIAFYIFCVIYAFSLVFSAFMAHKKSKRFCVATIIYVVLICFALGSIYLCAVIMNGKYYLAAVGITMFWISDMLILIRETRKDTTLIRKLIWVFYPIGQMLIVLSI